MAGLGGNGKFDGASDGKTDGFSGGATAEAEADAAADTAAAGFAAQQTLLNSGPFRIGPAIGVHRSRELQCADTDALAGVGFCVAPMLSIVDLCPAAVHDVVHTACVAWRLASTGEPIALARVFQLPACGSASRVLAAVPLVRQGACRVCSSLQRRCSKVSHDSSCAEVAVPVGFGRGVLLRTPKHQCE